MANMDGLGHLLSLKVMRVSRPALASAWEPFYSSSPSFSAHSTASVLSLQGKAPLPGHPKTLRDLTHATELLTLPSSFGVIQLGETFSSCLCINNEASVDIDGVSLKVEMQTVTSKVLLSDFGGKDCRLSVGSTLENVVNHEIKELGQHVLACTVAYCLPPNARNAGGPTNSHADPNIQTFRKFYKFVVTNPLSVKTKVHLPRSPSAIFSPAEKHKVFLEIHIQNLTQESLWFERMRFECVDGWTVEDGNMVECENGEKESIFSDSTALMQPQDTRQYIYVLRPKSIPSFPVIHEPGSSIPFGRLDISWRSAFGEPGRLLTSMLSRRIPLSPPVQQPASALPPYLKRTPTPSNAPSRPRSPQSNQIRPGTPPPVHRPGSPLRNRPQAISARSQSPDVPTAPLALTPIPVPSSSNLSDVQVNLLVRHIDRETIMVEKPFTISFSLTVSAAAPLRPPCAPKQRRILTLVVQHVQPPQMSASSPIFASNREVSTLQLSSFGLSASPSSIPSRSHLNSASGHRMLPELSSRQDEVDGDQIGTIISDVPLLPPPFAEGTDELKFVGSANVVFLGTSAVFLDPITLCDQVQDDEEAGDENGGHKLVQTVREFDLSYLPLRQGFMTVGGVRVLLVEDKLLNDDEGNDGLRRPNEVRVLEEWAVISEIWVRI